MRHELQRVRLETEAIVVGYAMSRLDKAYLHAHHCRSWKEAFKQAAAELEIRPGSLKNLRDEFDPVHDNRRKGWHQRPLRPNRQRILDELKDLSEDALLELVARILHREEDAILEAIDSLAVPPRTAHNVAERLLTGRRAEEFFLANCERLIKIAPDKIVDCRAAACGFDFGVANQPKRAIEVKGLKLVKGEILFTDREWTEAKARGADYLLVVVGNLAATPRAKVLPHPYATLEARCDYQVTVAAVWRSTVTLAG
jgi:Domain of unknown function (DUF3883)